MKKMKLFFAGVLASALTVTAFGGGLGTYDFADFGTAFSITNSGNSARTISKVFITYDAAGQTNTITIDRTYASTTWRVDTEAGSNVQYDLWEPTVALQWRPGEVITFTTSSQTNCQLLLEFTENE